MRSAGILNPTLRIFRIGVIGIAAAGCTYPIAADGMFVVSGDTGGRSVSAGACEVLLFSEGRSNLLNRRHVSGAFSVDFVVAPHKANYEVALVCNGNEQLSGLVRYGHEVNAGEEYVLSNAAL